jgi:hypothetical protein
MRIILFAVLAAFSLFNASQAQAESGGAASAATSGSVCTTNVVSEVQGAIAKNDFNKVNVISAKNPTCQGDIAMYLLKQSQNASLTEDQRTKLFNAAAPFGSQISLSDSQEAANIVQLMLTRVSDPAFQKANPKDAAAILATILSISSQANILAANPNLHILAVADAGSFSSDYPGEVDKNLQEQVDLALSIGAPPPLGPRGIINPSVQ